ncbi:MAG: hypothetical protein MR606_03060 [Mollicutes bacterium]|nr:hypothetical protein [Mollicutes bacterium]
MENYDVCPKCGYNDLIKYDLYSESMHTKFYQIFCPKCEWCTMIREDYYIISNNNNNNNNNSTLPKNISDTDMFKVHGFTQCGNITI